MRGDVGELFEIRVRSQQLLLRLFALRDVHGDAAHRRDAACRVVERKLHRDVGVRTVIVRRDLLELHRPARRHDLPVVFPKGARHFRGKKIKIALSHHFLAGDVKEFLILPVHHQVAAVRVLHENHRRSMVDHRLHLLLRVALCGLRPFAFGEIRPDPEKTQDPTRAIPQRRHREQDGEAASVLAEVGPLAVVRQPEPRLRDARLESRRHRPAQFRRQLLGARRHLRAVMEDLRRHLPDQFFRGVTKLDQRAGIDRLDEAIGPAGDDREVCRIEHRPLP